LELSRETGDGCLSLISPHSCLLFVYPVNNAPHSSHIIVILEGIPKSRRCKQTQEQALGLVGDKREYSHRFLAFHRLSLSGLAIGQRIGSLVGGKGRVLYGLDGDVGGLDSSVLSKSVVLRLCAIREAPIFGGGARYI